MADESVCIGPAESAKSYLNIPAIISACEVTDSDAIHHRVGFLAENDRFAEQVRLAGILSLAPMQRASRSWVTISAKEAVSSSGMQCVPGTGKFLQLIEKQWKSQKDRYPVIIKAAAGGGGKGIQIVEEESDLLDKLQLTQREALNSFGGDEICLEKFLTSPDMLKFKLPEIMLET